MGYLIFCLVLGFVFVLLSYMASFSGFSDEEKVSVFECGFSPLEESRLSFSIQFFLISLVFLIFDVEISLLLPSPLFSAMDLGVYFSMLLFVLILFYGFLYEWWGGMVDWSG